MRVPSKKHLVENDVAVEQFRDIALINKKTLAKLLGVEPWTIDHWRRQGRIPQPITLSSQTVAWRKVDVERWLIEKQLQSPTPRVIARRRNDEKENPVTD